MDKHFPGYYPITDEELKTIISSSTVVLGPSVLLDLYRIKDWKSFLYVIEQNVPLEHRWLPYDVAWYYHSRLPETINDELEHVKSAANHLRQFKEMIDDKRHHPFVDGELIEQYNNFVKSASDTLNNTSANLTTNFRIGEIKKHIADLYQDKIGDEYDESRMAQLISECNQRNAKQQCPCLSLSKSRDERIKANRYIIWKQMQQHAKETMLPIVFVVNRITPNWFAIYNDVIVPVPSLVNEFQLATSVDIHIISAFDFVKQFNDEHNLFDGLLSQLNNKPTLLNSQQIELPNKNQQVNG